MARLQLNQAQVRATPIRQVTPLVRKTTSEINRVGIRNAPGGSYSTGRLKASITWNVKVQGTDVKGTSGSDLDYAIFPERGTKPHRIVPRRAPHLRFYWRRVGHVVRFNSVNHPGSAAQNYMTRALLTVAPRKGFKVVIYS